MANANDTQRQPEVGTTVHFCLVGGPVALDCVPAIIVEVEDGSKLGPNELPRDRMVTLAIVRPEGRQIIGGIGYAPLSDRDLTGSWHFKSEHESESEQ